MIGEAASANDRGYAVGEATSARRNTSLPPSASTTIVSPSWNSPRSSAIASGWTISFWIARFSGRAPYTGSKPSRASSSLAAGVSSSVILRSASRLRSPRSWISTIALDLLQPERVEDHDLVDAVEQLRPEMLAHRLHHPLADLVRDASAARARLIHWLPRLLVMITIVLRKSTVRP